MNENLFSAILAMDSYNRGYNARINLGDPILACYGIGNAQTYLDKGDPAAEGIGFYAVSYQYNGGIVVAYRGTDETITPTAADVIHGYGIGSGDPTVDQGEMALAFYNAVATRAYTDGITGFYGDPWTSPVTFVGHSMGGGIAGLVATTYGKEAYLFDSMAFGLAAEVYAIGNESLNDPSHIHTTSIEDEAVTALQFLSATPDNQYSLGPDVSYGLLGLTQYGVPDAYDLHNNGTLVIRLYAEGIVADDWQSVAKYFWPVLYDNNFATQIGMSEIDGSYKDEGSIATILRTLIAYSAIDEGTRVYGDTGIRAFYDDANQFGIAEHTTGSPEIFGLLGEDISKLFIQYAGTLAKEMVLDSFNANAKNGVLDISSGCLKLDLSDSTWTVSGSTPTEIVIRDDLLDSMFNYGVDPNMPIAPIGIPRIEAEIALVKAGMTYAWGSASYDLIETVVLPYSVTSGTVTSVAASTGHVTLLYAAEDNVNQVEGSSGDDLIFTGNFNQTINGSAGSDVIYAGKGLDTVNYSSFANGITSTLDGMGGVTVIKNGTDKDALIGVERVFGTNHDDIFLVQAFGKVKGLFINGQDGSDTISFANYANSGLSVDLNFGTTKYLSADGTIVKGTPVLSFNNIENVIGSKFNDTLIGASNENTLTGGGGADKLTGNAGKDVFAFAAGDGNDVVTDYSYAEGDHLRFLSGILPDDLSFSRPDGSTNLNITYHGSNILLENVFLGDGQTAVTAEFNTGTFTFIVGPDGVASFPSNLAPMLNGGLGVNLSGTSAGETLNGTEYNDKLDGFPGNDTLVGHGGNDSLTGHDGDDFLDGGDGNDAMFGGHGSDTFEGGLGDDVITVGDDAGAKNIAHGGDDNDWIGGRGSGLTPTGSVNHFFGDAGDDYLHVAGGNDTLDGGSGSDTLSDLAGGTNILIGGADNDYVYAWGAGNVTVIDGAGEDYYSVGIDATGTVIYAATDHQNDQFAQNWHGVGTLSFALGSSGIVIDDSGVLNSTEFGNDSIGLFNRIIGTQGNDTFTGSGRAAIYDGGAGNDYFDTQADVIGGIGADTFVGGTVSNILDYNFSEGDLLLWEPPVPEATIAGLQGERVGNDLWVNSTLDVWPYLIVEQFILKDFFVSGDGSIYLEGADTGARVVLYFDADGEVSSPANFGSEGNDSLLAGAGGGLLAGYGGSDTLTGGTGNDTLDGGASNDTMAGDAGDDTYIVSEIGDVVSENFNDGDDTVLASISYTLGDNIENLTLTGNDDIDGDGNELSNVLTGNIGSNILAGAQGSDTYNFAEGYGQDTVQDESGALDEIAFNASVDVSSVTYVRQGSDLIISYGLLGDSVVVKGFYTSADTVEQVHFSDSTIHDADYINTHTAIIVGTDENDTINGTTGSEIISGLGGDDILNASGGDDTLEGGAGADTLIGGEGNDVFVFTEGGKSDVIIDSAGLHDKILFLEGILASSIVYTRSDDDLIIKYGNQDDSVLVKDYFVSEDTIEEIVFADSAVHDFEYVQNHLEQIIGSAGNDTISGTLGLDTLEGLAGNDILRGFSGDDTLDGGADSDSLYGGLGNDTYIVDNTGDYVYEAGNEGVDSVISSINYQLTADVENLTLIGSAISGVGNAQNNIIMGNNNDNSLDGGVGVDTLVGGAGNDLYIVDNISDAVIEASREGIDTVQSSVTFTLSSTQEIENLTLTGSSAINGTGNDLDNTLTGNTGINTLTGGSGNDLYIVQNATDVVIEVASGGTDTIQSSVTFTLSSAQEIENLTLTGSTAINGTGNTLANILTGNSGNNTLDGGAGADTMIGGGGDDTFIVDNTSDVVIAGSGADTISSSITWSLSGNADIESLTLTGSSAINATGNSFDNTLTGNTGNNTLDGGAGSDKMIGGSGDDVYIVDNIGDVITEAASSGTDSVISSVDYTLALNVENLTLAAASGNINGTGNTLVNILIGNSGDNTLNGGSGADTMIGGGGNDTYIVDSASDIVIGAAGVDTILSSIAISIASNADIENITLTGAAGNATGNNLVNILIGNTSGNTLDGGVGADTMMAGLGNDFYNVDDAGDTVIENAGEGTDTVRANISYTLSSNVENLTLTGTDNINATGNSLNNVITGNSGNNTLDGGAGNDSIVGGGGNDTYMVDSASDVVIGNTGIDTIVSGLSWSVASNATIENIILSGSAAVNATGNALVNVLTGNSGNNTLDGGTGVDTLIGGGGNDTFVVDNVGDSVTAGTGIDTINSSISWSLTGNTDVENLTLTGSSAINATGNDLNNVLTGNSGINTLTGGLGDDTYVIQTATDIVVEAAGQGNDTVQTGVTYTLTSDVENLILTGTSAVNAFGNALDNVLTGNSGANSLDGGVGADTMNGGAGNDVYFVDNAGDVINENASEGTDSVQSSISYSLNYTGAQNVENLTLTGTTALSATGNSLNNVITGNTADNTLDGGAGVDTMSGGTGNDTYIVDSTSDVVSEGASAGTDLVIASASFTLGTNVENLTLSSGAGNINATGNTLVNVLTGNSDDNTLNGSTGADTLIGNGGNDTFVVDNVGDVVTAGAGNDTISSSITWSLVGNTDVENLTLGTGNINATGNDLDNVLTGGSGANTLDGGVGADTMIGGIGNDLYIVDNAGDLVVENSGEGTDTIQASVSIDLTSTAALGNVENVTLTGSSNLNVTGNDLNNTLTGNTGNNVLDGGSGNDRMVGDLGDDTYVVDSASDVVVENASAGTDLVQSSVTYTLGTNLENLTLTGSTNINGTGNTVVNTITGNSGDNTLDGGTGADTLIGGGGNDTFIVDNAADTIVAGSGIDTINAGVTWSLATYTNVENLTLTGNTAINATGNNLDNILTGNTGVNTLTGGFGNDTYIVQNTTDVVIEASGQGTDSVQSSVTYTLAAAQEIENLTLTGATAINGTGNTLVNIVTGNSGNNTLDGGTGADTLIGGGGNDTYVVDNVGDVVIGDIGVDTISASLTWSLISNNDIENLTLTGSSTINATGNSLDNILTGNTGVNTLTGGLGDDTYVVQNTTDAVVENSGEGTDLVQSSVTYTLSNYVENLTLTGSTAINGTGNSLDNILTGNTGVNTLTGGLGNDTYIVQNTTDVVIETSEQGTDLVQSSVTYTLAAAQEIENLTLTGTSAINGFGNTLNNIIIGNTNNNTLDGGTGADSLIGGTGNDIYVVDNAGDVVVENASEGTDTVQSSITYTLVSNVENLTLTGTSSINGTGNELANVITGNTLVNTLSGMDGNDTIDGGTGADTMIGGTGNDTYTVDNASDVIIEAFGEGTDLVQSSVTYTLAIAQEIENLTLTGTSAINGTGNGLDNIITGNSGVNILTGNDGNDTLDGGTGADTLIGGAGDDLYKVDNASDVITELSGGGTDTVQSTVTHTLAANVENLTLMGSGAINGTGNTLDNWIIGGTGVNTLTSLDGNDTLDGGTGADKLIGGTGNDTYIVDNASDTITEAAGEGTDTVMSSVTHTLAANVEHLTLTGTGNINGFGNTLDNHIIGNTGANTLSGDAGSDTLDGGAGLDHLTGGADADIFVFHAATAYSNIDVVTDFSTSQNDAIDIRDLLTSYHPGIDALTDFVRITDNGTESVLSIDRDGAGTTYGFVQIATLSGVTGITDEDALATAGHLLVA